MRHLFFFCKYVYYIIEYYKLQHRTTNIFWDLTTKKSGKALLVSIS